jgi:hypothetical protein
LYESSTDPMDASIPACIKRVVSLIGVYCLAAVVGMMDQLPGLDLAGREGVLERGEDQVGVRAGVGLPGHRAPRERVAIADSYSGPLPVGIILRSVTYSRFGAGPVKSRWTRSGARVAFGSRRVKPVRRD